MAYDVRIRKVENGFIVKVGCKTFIALSWEDIATDVKGYFDDPEGTEKRYYAETFQTENVPQPARLASGSSQMHDDF